MGEQPLKSASVAYADYYADIRRHLAVEFSAEVRWSTASLFALNGGGLLALAQAENPTSEVWIAAVAFWFGIILAFVLVRYSQAKTREFMSIISGLEEQYRLQAATGESRSDEIIILEGRRRETATSLAPHIANGFFLAFSFGLVGYWLFA